MQATNVIALWVRHLSFRIPGSLFCHFLGPIVCCSERLNIIFHLLPRYDTTIPARDPHSTYARNIRNLPPAAHARYLIDRDPPHRFSYSLLVPDRHYSCSAIIIVRWIKELDVWHCNTASTPLYNIDPGTRSRGVFTPHYHNRYDSFASM